MKDAVAGRTNGKDSVDPESETVEPIEAIDDKDEGEPDAPADQGADAATRLRGAAPAPANYEIRYKCRRCGIVFRGGEGPESIIVDILDRLTLVEVTGNRARGLIPRHEIHHCEKGSGYGFADLVGAEKVKPKKEVHLNNPLNLPTDKP